MVDFQKVTYITKFKTKNKLLHSLRFTSLVRLLHFQKKAVIDRHQKLFVCFSKEFILVLIKRLSVHVHEFIFLVVK